MRRISRGRSSADVMKLYDVPAPMAHIPMRYLTINPLQALFVMNSAFVQRLAPSWRTQVEAEAYARGRRSMRSIARCLREMRPRTSWRSA